MPRLTPDEIHANHHRLIDERVAAYKAIVGTSGPSRYRRRERYKRAAHTLRVHLLGEHRLRARGGLSVTHTLDDLLAIHADEHERAPR